MKKILLLLLTLLLISCENVPTSILNDDGVNDILNSIESEDVLFEFGNIRYETLKDQIMLTNLKSTSIEKDLEQITLTLTYENENVTGSGQTEIEIDTSNDKISIQNLELDAIPLRLKDHMIIAFDQSTFEQYLSSNNTAIYDFKMDGLDLAIKPLNIISIMLNDYTFTDLNTVVQNMTIHASTSTFDLQGSFNATYQLDNNQLNLISIEMISEESLLVLNDDIIGRWTGQLVYDSVDNEWKDTLYLTILNVLEHTDDGKGYKGYVTYSAGYYINFNEKELEFTDMDARDDYYDKFVVASYEFTLTPGIEENSYLFTPGSWIKDPREGLIPKFTKQPAFLFILKDENALIGYPIGWENQLREYVSFDQNHDPFDND